MSCKQKRQLVRFPKVRILKQWFRHFNDHKEFHNEGNLHLFSLMALFSYANFRSNERVINGVRYMEAPGQWVCKLGSLPRILRVHSKAQALDLMKYFEEKGFLQFEVIDEDQEIIRYTINDWKRHCTHLAYNYYSYKGSGFFFFPLPIGRLLLRAAKTEGRIVFSELDALMDMWLHTIVNDPSVKGSEYMPVVYYSNMHGTTCEAHRYVLKNHILPWIGDCPLESLTTQKMEEFLEEHQLHGNKRNGKPLSQQTMRHIQNLLSKVLSQAVNRGLIERNPVQGICRSAPKQVKATILADNEIRDYLSAAKDFHKLTERVLMEDLYDRTPHILDHAITILLG